MKRCVRQMSESKLRNRTHHACLFQNFKNRIPFADNIVKEIFPILQSNLLSILVSKQSKQENVNTFEFFGEILSLVP